MNTTTKNTLLIAAAQRMTIGTDYQVVNKRAEYKDENGFETVIRFTAVEFTNSEGSKCFISELFLS